MKLFDRVLNPREIRRRLGLNQEQFWTQIGVTQSGGSRYESGREMPKPVRELLRLVHVEQIDLSQVKRVDFEIISYLKASHPDLYRTLRRAVKGQPSPEPTAASPREPARGRDAGPERSASTSELPGDGRIRAATARIELVRATLRRLAIPSSTAARTRRGGSSCFASQHRSRRRRRSAR